MNTPPIEMTCNLDSESQSATYIVASSLFRLALESSPDLLGRVRFSLSGPGESPCAAVPSPRWVRYTCSDFDDDLGAALRDEVHLTDEGVLTVLSSRYGPMPLLFQKGFRVALPIPVESVSAIRMVLADAFDHAASLHP